MHFPVTYRRYFQDILCSSDGAGIREMRIVARLKKPAAGFPARAQFWRR
jgi:hypothetical protein